MARLPDSIKNIDGSKETLKLEVRITDLWFVGASDRSEQAEMILIDSNADKIHVVVRKDQLKSWKSILKEGSAYVMHNFKVIRNEGLYRLCSHPYKLIFTGVTVIRETELPTVPFRKYDFIKFGDIIANNFERGLLIDVIGVVHELTFQHVGSENTRCVFTLKDLSGESVTCTLWEEYCLKFLNYLKECNGMGPIVIILTHARIKDPQGIFPATVSNSLKASKLMINEELPEINEFIERLAETDIAIQPNLVAYSQSGSQVSGSSQFTEKDRFFYKTEVKTLPEINAISDETICITVGTIGMIVADNHGWCYASCGQCNKKAETVDGPFTCKCGKYNQEFLLRYRVEVMVYHKGHSSKFLLWDRECLNLIGQPAAEVNKLKIEGGDDNLNISPKALDNILGATLAFKVKTQPKYKNSSVLKISDDMEIIKSIMELMSDAENVDSVCTAIDTQDVRAVAVAADTQNLDSVCTAVHTQDVHAVVVAADTQDATSIHLPVIDAQVSAQAKFSDEKIVEEHVSVSADHDPAIGSPSTPIKRPSMEKITSDDMDEELIPTQMSANKMTKRVKDE